MLMCCDHSSLGIDQDVSIQQSSRNWGFIKLTYQDIGKQSSSSIATLEFFETILFVSSSLKHSIVGRSSYLI